MHLPNPNHTKSKLLFLISGLAAGVTLGWSAAKWLSPDQMRLTASSGTAQAARTNLLQSTPSDKTGAGKAVASGLPTGTGMPRKPASTKDDAAGQFRLTLRNPNPIQRANQLLALLDLIKPENAETYLEGWLIHLRKNKVDPGLESLINHRFGQTMGPKIVGNRKGSDSDMRAAGGYVKDQFLGWIESDPGAARKWLDGLENEDFREAMIGGYLSHEALQDPKGITSTLKTFPEDLQSRYGSEIVRSLRETKSAEEVNEWIKALATDDPASRDSKWLRAVADGFMENETSVKGGGARPAEFYEAHAGQPYLSSEWGARAAARYAEESPAAAMDWAFRMAGREEFAGDAQLMSSAVQAVQNDKLQSVADQCSAFPPGQPRDAALAALARRYTDNNQPDQAAKLAASISDEKLREEILHPKPPPQTRP